ncbi:hypothetical protein ACIA5E_26880 [Nocardia asteroides]|uniref:hypothetical protein n=1 Tax=Nocardia asteroides TaxID=1824 RepID=UPI0037B06787
MAEDRPYTALERKRLARQQRSPEFRAWLDREETDLARLLAEVPGLADLADPWTLDGLALIEDTTLARLDIEGEPTADDVELFSLFARGVGYTYLRVLGAGSWVWAATVPSADPGPVLQLPECTEWVSPEESLAAALHYRTRGSLAEQVAGIQSFQDWARRHPATTA